MGSATSSTPTWTHEAGGRGRQRRPVVRGGRPGHCRQVRVHSTGLAVTLADAR
jgi:hypothetical protein